MNAAYLHLVTNHIPVLGSFGVLFILIYGFLSKNASLKKLGLILSLLVAVSGFVVFKSGHQSEKIAKSFAGVTEKSIDEHEEAAEFAYYLIEATGGCALLALLLCKKPKLATLFTFATLVGALVSSGATARSAKLGGEIRHPEVRPDFVLPTGPESQEGHHHHSHSD